MKGWMWIALLGGAWYVWKQRQAAAMRQADYPARPGGA